VPELPMPFPDESFDKIFCFGVLQHTPNFEESIKSLISKAMLGGEIVVDFYPINGWWTKISAKYILRPILKKVSHSRLLRLIENNVDWMIGASQFLHKFGLDILTRFLPSIHFILLSTVKRGQNICILLEQFL
jgi:2-polyprenyl-3-methyl-5-hydroxy-6-metoxy-1,4-benzoquinol methylase